MAKLFKTTEQTLRDITRQKKKEIDKVREIERVRQRVGYVIYIYIERERGKGGEERDK